jgi:hypothetical protein
MLGDLRFPPGGLLRFRGLTVDPTRRDDWLDDLAPRGFSPRAVPQMLAFLEELRGLGNPIMNIVLDEQAARFQLRACLDEDHYYDYGAAIAELFRVAGEAGGTGTLTFTSLYIAGPPPLVVAVSPKSNSVRRLTQAEETRVQKSEAFLELDAEVEALTQRLLEEEDGGTPAKKTSAAAKKARAKRQRRR